MQLQRRNLLLICLLFAILATILYIPAAPPLHPIQDRDAGVFLYIAKQMQTGSVPYRDVWDHKLLGTYILPFMGFAVTGGSLWGPWLFAVLSLAISACLGYLVLRSQIGALLSLAVISVWLFGLSLFVQRDPFLTETTALPFQIGSFLLVLWLAQRPVWERARWGWLALGATIAFSALLKPMLAGLPCLAALLILWHIRHRERWTSILWMGFGIVGPFAGALFYLLSNHAWESFYDQVLLYNLAYANVSWLDRLLSLASMLQQNLAVSLAALFAWIGMGFFILRGKPCVHERLFLFLFSIGWPVDLALSALSGRPYAHYYIGNFWLASAMIGWLLFKLQDYIPRRQILFAFRYVFLGSLLIASLQVWFQILTMQTVGEPEQRAAISYLSENVPQNKSVLFWGAETSLYLATHRTAPTRVVYQYPLYTLGYGSAKIAKELLNNIETQKPEIIIDTSPTNPAVPPLDPAGLLYWHSPVNGYGMTPGGDMVSSYVSENYEVVDLINGVWPVYRLKK